MIRGNQSQHRPPSENNESFPLLEAPKRSRLLARGLKMSSKFELKKSRNGKFMFNLKAGNNEIILTSQMYESKASAETGIASVQQNSPLDERYERKTGSDGKPY